MKKSMINKVPLGRRDYYKYINSADWQDKRKNFYNSKMYKKIKGDGKWNCYCCGISNVSLDLHHRTYKRLGVEHIGIDLVPVCRNCHDEIHNLQKSSEKHIWECTTKIKNIKQKLRRKKEKKTPEAIQKRKITKEQRLQKQIKRKKKREKRKIERESHQQFLKL